MRNGRLCAALLTFALLAWHSARAASLADFNAAAEDAASHNRVAIGYLRTGNTDLAMLEIERLRASWTALAARFSSDRPVEFAPSAFGAALTDIGTRLAAADMFARSGRLDQIESSLIGVRDALSNLRRQSGTEVLADCILDSSIAMKALGDYDHPGINLRDPTERNSVLSAANRYRQVLQRCNTMAPPAVKESPEFRRLVDGAVASVALLPDGLAKADHDLLHRIVIELRSFDNLLAFRFG